MVPAGDDRWRCECGTEGTFEELDAVDCEKGLAPVYEPGEPFKVVLAEERDEYFVKRFEVARFDDYARDANFDRARRIKDAPRAEILRRLGGIRGTWTCYSVVDGSYIGPLHDAEKFRRHGVVPQGIDEESRTSSIGFCERDQTWHGWSHRAWSSFGIGHVVKVDSVEASDYEEPAPGKATLRWRVPPGFECKTLDDCKRVAIAFAAAVS
jgi:hypothetical protein